MKNTILNKRNFNLYNTQKRLVKSIPFLMVLFFLTGCSSITLHNINKLDSKKEYKQILTDVVILTSSGNGRIQYTNYQNLNECRKKHREFVEMMGKKNTLQAELLAREIKLNYLNKTDKPKRVLLLAPLIYTCTNEFPIMFGQLVNIHLYDIENISKDWDKSDIRTKINQIKMLSNDSIIYRKEYQILGGSEESFVDLSSDIASDLERLGILPQKVKTIEQVLKELEEKRNKAKKTALKN
ncbi:MAG: hypothetical protein ACNI3C_04840 [Candidatus Marinarcus sp.]|uniref:hypothetical protein n=1 Tax=Candidatus Marinarcus sp. TaxID=3100987 RepID=UPI003AFFA0CC